MDLRLVTLNMIGMGKSSLNIQVYVILCSKISLELFDKNM